MGSDDSRHRLDAAAVPLTTLWRAVEVVDVTGSTNADLLTRASDGADEGIVLAAEEQTAGRGRLGRSWASPPRSSLMFSVLLRPGPAVPPSRWGWLPLLTGVAVVTAIRELTAVPAVVKWPNDVLAGGAGKLAGILAEAAGGAVVIGTGLNVSTRADELPPPGPGSLPPTSLLLAGAAVLDRNRLLVTILAGLEQRYLAWRAGGGDPEQIRAEYTAVCDTLGRRVLIEVPAGQPLSGEAVDVDSDGRLVVRSSADADVDVAVAAGDVVHVR